MAAPENPFRQRRAFVGRQAELSALGALLGGGQSTLLVGGRRTGKTTLLERLPEPGRPVVRCDAAAWDLGSEAGVLAALAAAVTRQPARCPVTREDLEAVLAEAAPLVVAIDEADRLLGEPWSGRFLSFLRYLDDTALRSSVGFLLAGGPMLAAYRNPDDLGSPPLNTAEPVFLGPLAEEEVAQLAAHAHRPVDLARLWADAAGHPQLLSGLLARVVDGRSYDDAVDSLLDVALRDFAVWHRQLGEAGRAFLRRLPDHGVARQELSRGSWLPVREGYVLARCTCLIRAEDGRIRPGPGLFAGWLAAHDTTSQPTPEWDLAISYASEDEKLAAAIHKGLRSRFRVFFAAEQEAYLWGEQLGDALPSSTASGAGSCWSSPAPPMWPSTGRASSSRRRRRSWAATCSSSTPESFRQTCRVMSCTEDRIRRAWSHCWRPCRRSSTRWHNVSFGGGRCAEAGRLISPCINKGATAPQAELAVQPDRAAVDLEQRIRRRDLV